MYEIYNDAPSSYRCKKTEYFEDVYVSQEYWIKKKKEINHDSFELDFASAVGKFSDGTTGYKDGEFAIFHNSMLPLVTGKYYKEDMVGLWTFYYYDQNVKIESNYTQNKQIDEKYFKLNGEPYSGKFVYKDNSNRNGIKEIRKIKNGLRDGKTTYIDMNTNKTIKKENYKNGKQK